MAKFRLSKDSVFSIGGNAITCVTEVSFDENVDTYISACEDSNNYRPQVLGGITVTGSVTYELETDDDTVLGYIDPLDSGAWIFQPHDSATAASLKFTSTNIQITSRNFSASRTGLTTGVAGFICDDLTITVNTP